MTRMSSNSELLRNASQNSLIAIALPSPSSIGLLVVVRGWLWYLVPARWERAAARVAAAVLGTPGRSSAGPSALRWPAHPPRTAGGLLRSDFNPAAHAYLLSAQRRRFSRALKPNANLVESFTELFYHLKAERKEQKIISLHSSWDSAGWFKVNTALPFVENCGGKSLLPVRFAQEVVAGARVSRVGDVVSDLQLLWWVKVFAAAPLALGGARWGNGTFAGWRRKRVVPRVVAVQTFAPAG